VQKPSQTQFSSYNNKKINYACSLSLSISKKLKRKVKLSLKQDVEDPILSKQLAHRWRLGCHPYKPAAFYSQKDLLVLMSVRCLVHPGAMGWIEG
jgi:hypothetical protein